MIFGGSGAIGNAFAIEYATIAPQATIHVVSSKQLSYQQNNIVNYQVNYQQEDELENLANIITAPIDRVIVATGMLHSKKIQPEKDSKQLDYNMMQQVFMANTFVPAIIAKHFIPKLNQQTTSVYGMLSARVGSITDNQLGGWYSYRAAKAALNMLIKTLAIETKRKNKHAIIVGLHPGTVDSNLSKPFQANVPKEKLFSPTCSVQQLNTVINQLQTVDSGNCFAWDGEQILP